MTSIRLVLDVIRPQIDGDDLAGFTCTGCRGDLAIHQPDVRLPDRLLGTCDSCSAWYLIDAAAVLMVRLPDQDTLRAARTALIRRDEPAEVGVGHLGRAPSRSGRARGVRPRAPG